MSFVILCLVTTTAGQYVLQTRAVLSSITTVTNDRQQICQCMIESITTLIEATIASGRNVVSLKCLNKCKNRPIMQPVICGLLSHDMIKQMIIVVELISTLQSIQYEFFLANYIEFESKDVLRILNPSHAFIHVKRQPFQWLSIDIHLNLKIKVPLSKEIYELLLY